MRALKRANNNNEGRKEAGFVRDLSASRRIENERKGEEKGSRPKMSVWKKKRSVRNVSRARAS
jgi:hypothetical protein